MLLRSNGLKREFGERLSDTNDGFELADRDRDGASSVAFEFSGVNLFANGDEVGGELLSSFGG